MQLKTADCLLKLKAECENLNPATKKVAEYILANPGDVIECNIVDLAEKIGVSPYSIVSCIKSINYGGYKDFKISLAQDYDSSSTTLFEGILATDDSYTIFRKTLKKKVHSLFETENLVDANSFKKAVSLIVEANRIECYGIGYSNFASETLSMNLRRLSKNSMFFSDPNYQQMSSVMLNEKDLAIGFSTSGASKSIVKALKYAKEAKANTIAITSIIDSPITQHADYVLLTSYSDPTLIKDTISSSIEQLTLVSAISLAVGHIDVPHALVNLSETSAVIGSQA